MDPFISATDLNNYLGLVVDADKAAIAVDAACDTLRKTADQSLDYVSGDVVVLDSDGGHTLLLPELPVYTVTSVVGPGSVALVEGVNYVVDLENGALQTKEWSSRWMKGRKIYTVTYSHGYVDNAAAPGLPANAIEWPAALRIIALQLASRIYDQGLVSSESVGGYSSTYSVGESISLSDREISMLERVIGPGRRR